MRNILILGASGNLGKVLTKELLKKNYNVTALLRNPQKLIFNNTKLKIQKGDITNENDLENSLKNSEVVISTLGHGFRTKYPIQENTLKVLIPLMEKKKINRFITVTGAALRTSEDSDSIILEFTEKIFSLIDPYRLNDAKTQQKLLEKSKLDWTVIRTPIHKSSDSIKLKSISYKQTMPWYKISRIAISKFIIENIEDKKWIRKSPIIY